MVSLDGRYQDAMNYHIKEEGLPSFDIADFDFDVNFKTETAASNQWDWESEKVINGDVAVIPSCSEVASMEYAANSPPASVDYYKMGGDWHQLVNMEMLDIENNPLEHEERLANMLPDFISDPDLTISPKAHYLTLPKNSIVSSGKKIDMNAKCYITDNNQRVSQKVELSSDSENETDDESGSEQSDSESSNTSSSRSSRSNSSNSDMQSSESLPEQNVDKQLIDQQNQDVKIELDNPHGENLENDFIDVDGISNDDLVLLAGDVDSLLEQFEATSELPKLEETNCIIENQDSFQIIINEVPQQNIANEAVQQLKVENSPKTHPVSKSPSEVNTQVTNNKSDNQQHANEKSKQILDSLPPELIKKIQSNKRKMVPVIDPVPNKKRAVINKKHPEAPQQKVCEKGKKQPQCYAIKLDHTYCTTDRKIEEYKRIEQSATMSYPKHPNKDSGFQSSEEDNSIQINPLNPLTTINERSILKSNILKRQMSSANVNIVSGVSMLKSKSTANNNICLVKPGESNNSISSASVQSSPVKESHKKKKKLNLDEYKKRRELPWSGGSSQNDSPTNSGPCSPSATKVEQERYQQRLMEMAAEVLKATPKAAAQTTPIAAAPVVEKPAPPAPATALQSVAVVPPTLPPHLEKKELVSIGVNTDGAGLTWKHVPLRELEEIRPILENASDKISNNSLIASVIENVQNKKIKGRLGERDECNKKVATELQHGEDKIIMWPEKNRPKAPTKDASVQTEAVLETTPEVVDFKRKRSSSSSSSSEDRKRSSSRESRYSYTSQSSSYSYSSSRSRSPSPGRPRYRRREDDDEERIREVYERRIVYVGGISASMTKENLRRRFQKFGHITKVSVHFPDHRDNYGFVTYVNKKDAYKAVEHGNDDPSVPRYDLNFGGRRIFCRTEYADLDNVGDDASYSPAQNVSFDSLLREAQAKLRKRKST